MVRDEGEVRPGAGGRFTGALFAGAGDDGRVWRITARGQGEVYYETGQAHVTALAFDKSGALLAGSEPNGNLYRITAKDRATVLYHSSLPEIREIAVLTTARSSPSRWAARWHSGRPRPPRRQQQPPPASPTPRCRSR